MKMEKPLVPEEVVHGEGGLRADAEKRPVFVRSRPQVGDRAQELVGVTLLLQRKGFRVGHAQQAQSRGLDLPLLAGAGGLHEGTRYLQGRSGADILEQVKGWGAFVHDHLHVLKAGAVVDLQKGESLGIAPGADPAFDQNAVHPCGAVQGGFNECALHASIPRVVVLSGALFTVPAAK